MSTFKLIDLLEVSDHRDSNFNFIVTESTGTTVVFSGVTFCDYVKHKYTNRLYLCYEPVVFPETAYRLFVDAFDSWKARNEHNYARIINMNKKDYDPLENYDRIEEGAIEVTRVNGEQRQSATTTITATTTSNSYTYGDNSSDPVPESKTENMITYPDGVDGDTSSTTAESYTDTDTTTYNNHRIHGNIGVTTGAQLYAGELEIRLRDIVSELIDRFIDEYTLYI